MNLAFAVWSCEDDSYLLECKVHIAVFQLLGRLAVVLAGYWCLLLPQKKYNKMMKKAEKERIFLILSYLVYMSCKLLTHPSISTYTRAINFVLTGPSGLSAIPPLIIYSVAVITWVFAVFLCFTALTFCL